MLGRVLPVALAFLPAAFAVATPRQIAQGQGEYYIAAADRPYECLRVADDYPVVGSAVVVFSCSSTLVGTWTVGPGANPNIRFTGSNLCLDAGPFDTIVGAGLKLTLATCDASKPGQKWSYGSDQRLTVTGRTQCLDSAGDDGRSPLNVTNCGSSTTQTWSLLPPNTEYAPFEIHPNGDMNTCLVASALTYGAPVWHGSCDQAILGAWTIRNGTNGIGIQLDGANGLCLTASQADTNTALVTVDSCDYVKLLPRQQLWFYTGDNRIAIQGGNQCLDIGPKRTDGAVQTYACSSGNINQVWTTSPTNYPLQHTLAPPTPPVTGVQLHANGNATACLALRGNTFKAGSPLALAQCLTKGAEKQYFQTFTFKRNQPTSITTTAPTAYGPQTLCVDFGANTSGVVPTLSPCQNTPQQTFWVTNDNRVAVYNGDQCLDVVAGSKPNTYDGTLADVQSWKCTPGDTQQIFTQ